MADMKVWVTRARLLVVIGLILYLGFVLMTRVLGD